MPSPSQSGVIDTNSMGSGGSLIAPSAFRGTSFLSSPRFKELDRRQSYYDCQQHDGKKYDFDGRIIDLQGPGAMSTQRLLNSDVAPYYVPLRARRPSAPARLARVITNAFTNMVFGAQRFPELKVEGDPDTQDFDAAIAKATSLSTKMIRARTIGGSVGTVGMSWCFDRKGRPRIETHNGKYLFVHDWEDREELVPKWVTEVYLTARPEWDGSRKKFVINWYWHRRDWDARNDILFKECLYKAGEEPIWMPDPLNSVTHDDGFCHMTWIQNLPTEDLDGLPDFDGLFDLFDSIDILNSVVVKGAILNLDPTLVLKIDRDIAGSMGVKTGSDDALIVGEEGGAEYLELTGTSLESGIKLLNEQRRNALETAQCIVPDPADIAAQGISSVALKGIFGPMIGKCETLRDQYGKGMKRVLDQMTDVARAKLGQKTIIYVKNDAGEPEAQEVEFFIDLPAKVVETPQQSPDGQPVVEEDTGKPVVDTQKVELKPGDGGELELVWPEYFPATPADQAAVVTTLGTAAGGKPIISQQTAVEKTAAVYGVEPAEEWARVQKGNAEDKAAAAENAKAMGTDGDFAGGKPGADGMPEGAKPKPLAAPKFGGSKAPFGGKQDDDAGGDDDGGK